MLNIDEPDNHHAKLKNPVTKDHILYDSIYRKYPESIKRTNGCLGRGRGAGSRGK